MEETTANLWLEKALKILTTSNKPMSAKELHEKAGDSSISLPHAILAMKQATAKNLVEAHKQANKKATLFTAKNVKTEQKSKALPKADNREDYVVQLLEQVHSIMQNWIKEFATVDANLAAALLKLKK